LNGILIGGTSGYPIPTAAIKLKRLSVGFISPVRMLISMVVVAHR
jgi:hypothetical protein